MLQWLATICFLVKGVSHALGLYTASGSTSHDFTRFEPLATQAVLGLQDTQTCDCMRSAPTGRAQV